MTTTAVSYAGDKKEVHALKLLAVRRGISIGKLVRDAVYAQYGAEMAEALDELESFFANGGSQTNQMVSTQEMKAIVVKKGARNG